MAKRKSKKRKCGCGKGAVKVSRGKGRGFVCMRKKPKVTKRYGLTFVTHPFVRAVCR